MERTDHSTEMTESTANAETRQTPSTRDESRYLVPPVDILETDDALTVLADLPGVRIEDVTVRVENGLLTIEGRPSYRRPDELLYGEFDLARYYRQFRLTDRVDTEKISAELKHGVLRVRLPKAERLMPRSIEIKVG
jgi:HSP20 family molecular chaperone IbpA